MYLKSWWYGLQFLRIRVWQTKIGNYGSGFALLTPTPHPAKNPKNQNFEKIKKLLEISFYTCVTKPTIIWGMVSEIEWDRQLYLSVCAIFCRFTPLETQSIKFFKKWKMHMVHTFHIFVPKLLIIWCLLPEIWVQHTIFCHFGSFFALLLHYWFQKLKIEKNKKIFPFWNMHNK